MDPSCSFLLRVTKPIDADTTNFRDFVELIIDEFPPCYKDDILKALPDVKTDHDVGEWPPSPLEKGFGDVHDVVQTQPEKRKPMTNGENMQNEEDEDNYLANPLPENEHVGVDEEAIYLDKAPVDAIVVAAGYDSNPIPEDNVSSEDQEDNSNSCSYFGEESDFEEEEELVGKDSLPDTFANMDYDKENPPMTVGSTYLNMKEFKLALAQHAIKNEFEFNMEKSEPGRYRAYCSRKHENKCRWRIHASTMGDGVTMKVKKNPATHDCTSRRRAKKVKNATKYWVCEKVKDWLIEDATLGAKELLRRIKDDYKVKVHYKRVYMGKQLALNQLYGDWNSSFDNLYRFKAAIEESSPGSLVVLDHHTIKDKIRFRRPFIALKPCIDGFLDGCRPYLAIDSTLLTGRFKGHLVVAIVVDGHNWMYPIAFGVFDSETNDNWIWFMKRLREAIGSPYGLAICTDCGQAVMAGVKEAFPNVEHRECMFHLVQNFKKRWSGKVFEDHLWAAAYSWHSHFFEKHWAAMEAAKLIAMDYLRKWHTRLWTRSQFSTRCKEDDPDDIAAMMAMRGPPKKKKRTNNASSENSIVPFDEDAPAACMTFSPSQTIGGTNQSKSLSIKYPVAPSCDTQPVTAGAPKKRVVTKNKAKGNVQPKEKSKKKLKPIGLDSPAMGTRIKKSDAASPAMSTRSKRRLSL